MSLRKIEKSEYSRFKEYAKRCSANKVYPMSIAEGYQEGDIFVSSEEDFVMFWHYCGFVYFSGSPLKALLEEIYEEYLSQEQERRFIIITDDEAIKDFFSKKSDVIIDKRFEYAFGAVDDDTEDKTDSSIGNTAEDYSKIGIERISEKNIDRIHGRIIPSFSWDTKEAFLEKGFGYVATDGERIAAVAFSSAVSPEEVDIGLETAETYRYHGLASYLAYEMCEEIIRQGRRPVWAHAETNTGSQKTALSAGFKPIGINTVIQKK